MSYTKKWIEEQLERGVNPLYEPSPKDIGYWEPRPVPEEYLSECCNAPVRYLNCAECRANRVKCIWICSKCGAEV